MEEIWKDIKEYEGKYQISNFGNVRSTYDQNQFKKTSRIKNLKAGERNGYLVINLQNKAKLKGKKSYQIHRLVAEAFIPNPENKPIINHIDENRKNNVVTNLEWCTQKENVLHSKYKLFKCKNRIGKSKEKYICLRKMFNKTYYEVRIPNGNNKIYLGSFKNLEDAVQARDYNIKNKKERNDDLSTK